MSIEIITTEDISDKLGKGVALNVQYIDSYGDAYIGGTGYGVYGTSWIYKDQFVLPEEIKEEITGYVLTTTAKNVSEIFSHLASLNEYSIDMDNIEITPVYKSAGGN